MRCDTFVQSITTTKAPMKLPSVFQAAAEARNTFVRFPLVLLDAMIGTACALVLIDFDGLSGPTVLMQIVFGAILGFPLLTGLALTAEHWKWNRLVAVGIQFAGVVFVGFYSITVPQDPSGAPAIHIIRLLMLTVGMILFAFTVPFLKNDNEIGYWNFCKTVCLRVITAGIFAVVMWGGLAIALAALNNLFGVDVPAKRYAELWICINGVFSIWFFLAGVPKNPDSFDGSEEYPKGLKIFSLYILFPLVFIYFVILYAYLGKILLAWDWPQGWVSRLILGFIATGLTSLLLVHPIKDRNENIWMKTTARWFYVVIIPLTIMLFLAVWQRVTEYGFTEGRYLGIAAVVWLCVLAPYYIFSKKKKILFLPASLCVAVFVSSFGPWGMFAVSEKSQVHRLKELLVNNHILVDGRVQSTHDSLQSETTQEISSILDYLSEFHGFDAIQPWMSENLKRDSAGIGEAYKDPAFVAKLMGVPYVRVRQGSVDGIITLTTDRDKALNIAGYERLLQRQRILSGDMNREFSDQGIAYRIGQDLSMITVTVWRNTNSSDSLLIDLKPLIDNLIAKYGIASADKIPHEEMAFVTAKGTVTIKVFLSTLKIQRNEGKTKVISFEAQVAYKQGIGF